MQRELISALKPPPALPPPNHLSIERVLTLVPPASEPSALTKCSGNGAHAHRRQILHFVKAKCRFGSNCTTARPSPLLCTTWSTRLVLASLPGCLWRNRLCPPCMCPAHLGWVCCLHPVHPCTTAKVVTAPLPSQGHRCRTPPANPLLLGTASPHKVSVAEAHAGKC